MFIAVREKVQTKKKLVKGQNDRSGRGDFFIYQDNQLRLSDGEVFIGQSPAWQKTSIFGEVVFNTGMTGYVESLTDPSYAGQILAFTYPLIGNYGVDQAKCESDKIQVNGVIVSEAAEIWSHTEANKSLLEWLESQKIPIIFNVDTRALTKHLRSKGTMAGQIGDSRQKIPDIKQLSKFVSIDNPIIYNAHRHAKKIILVDCGSKQNILRSLLNFESQIKRVPYDYDYTNEDYDGVLISNGPGDPAEYKETIAIARKALTLGRPVFGICLGSQIMGLSAGAKSYKLKFGHRGHNQPCQEEGTNKCFITSQNHGYAIEEGTLPKDWSVWFRNLNDNSIEGIKHNSKPFFSVQFHPEACPGPTDTDWLFERFYQCL